MTKPEDVAYRMFFLCFGVASLALGATTPLQAQSAYEKAVLTKRPVAYWRLGDAKGLEVLDQTKNEHNGAVHGTPDFQQPGAIKGDANTAIRLDGKRSYIEIPSHRDFSQPTSGKGLTVEVWVRPDVLEFEGETDDRYIFLARQG